MTTLSWTFDRAESRFTPARWTSNSSLTITRVRSNYTLRDGAIFVNSETSWSAVTSLAQRIINLKEAAVAPFAAKIDSIIDEARTTIRNAESRKYASDLAGSSYWAGIVAVSREVLRRLGVTEEPVRSNKPSDILASPRRRDFSCPPRLAHWDQPDIDDLIAAGVADISPSAILRSPRFQRFSSPPAPFASFTPRSACARDDFEDEYEDDFEDEYEYCTNVPRTLINGPRFRRFTPVPTVHSQY